MATDLIDGYLAHLRSKSQSDRTIGARKETLHRLHHQLPYGLDEACTDELMAWLWRDGLKLSTRETYYTTINGFYGWAFTSGVFDFNPAEPIPRPVPPRRLPRPCTDEALQRIMRLSWEPFLGWSKLAAYGGLRCIEISRLDRAHIREDNILIVCGKGGKPRYVPTHPVVWEHFKDFPPGLIAGHDEHYISVCTAHHFRYRLGIDDVSLHRLRHWFGTKVQRLYKDLRVTQELLGHAHPNSTAGYAEVASESKAEAIGMLPTLGGEPPASDSEAAQQHL